MELHRPSHSVNVVILVSVWSCSWQGSHPSLSLLSQPLSPTVRYLVPFLQSAEQEAAVQEARMARAHAEARCSTLEQERASVQREAAELAAQVERLTNQASANEKEMAVLRRGMATQKERQQGAEEAARQASLAATSVMRERLASLESALETALAEGRAAAEAVQVAAAATEAAKAEAGASTAARLQAEAGLREAQRAQREAESQAKVCL